mgnify:CR=1 FL=1
MLFRSPDDDSADGSDSDGSDEGGAGDDSGGEPLVIDGPATVDDDESAEVDDGEGGASEVPAVSCVDVPRGLTETTLDGGGATHDVRIFVPENLVAEPVPTVLNWHGLGSNGPEQAAFTGYEALAETEGFIVVHPTGIDVGDGRNSWELTQFDGPERDDLAFADTLIDFMVSDFCADESRVYSTGMSNGGFFTSELVCNRSDRIAAAVSVAGNSHPESCDPDRAVPYLAFHGTDDGVVPFAGGGESSLSDEVDPDGFFGQVMPDEFAEFAGDAGCDIDPVRTEETAEVIRYDYEGCDDGAELAFYELPGSAHIWPNSPLADVLADFGFFTKDIDATVDGWAFMSQYSL